jgi:hypothetical protein
LCLFFSNQKLSLEYLDRLFDGPQRNDVEEAMVVPETEYKPELDHIERLPAVKE